MAVDDGTDEAGSDQTDEWEVKAIIDHDFSGRRLGGVKRERAFLVEWKETWMSERDISAKKLVRDYLKSIKDRHGKRARLDESDKEVQNGKSGRALKRALVDSDSESARSASDLNDFGDDLADPVVRKKDRGEWEDVAAQVLGLDLTSTGEKLIKLSWIDGSAPSIHSIQDVRKNCPQKLLDFLIPKIGIVNGSPRKK